MTPVEKMTKTCLEWLGHVRRATEAPMRKSTEEDWRRLKEKLLKKSCS